jgi:hypothetical protein
MQEKIATGVATVLGYIGAAGALLLAIISEVADENVLGLDPETYVKIAAYAGLAVMAGRYGQAIAKVIRTGAYDGTVSAPESTGTTEPKPPAS